MSSHRCAGWSRFGRLHPAWSAIRSITGGAMVEVPEVAFARSGVAHRPAPSLVQPGSSPEDLNLAMRAWIRSGALALSEARRAGNRAGLGLVTELRWECPGRTAPRRCLPLPRRTGGRARSSSRRPTSTVASCRELPTGSSSSSRAAVRSAIHEGRRDQTDAVAQRYSRFPGHRRAGPHRRAVEGPMYAASPESRSACCPPQPPSPAPPPRFCGRGRGD